MPEAEKLKQILCEKFPFLAEKFVVQREKRLYAEVPPDRFLEVAGFAKGELKFIHVSTITGTYDKENLTAMYHMAHDDGTLLSLRQHVPRESPVIQSITGLFPGCANYERELVDLLGCKVENLPPGNRYPMPDDFPRDQHPLRKDWKPVS